MKQRTVSKDDASKIKKSNRENSSINSNIVKK